jgi:5-methylcytosine-specific restriction endonuclease McrA
MDDARRLRKNKLARIRYAADPVLAEKRRARVRAYRLEHLDEIREAGRIWARENRKAHPERGRAWDAANREKRRESSRLRRLNSPEKVRAWRVANPDKRRDQKHRRRALMQNVQAERLTKKQRLTLYSTRTCYLCGKDFQPGDRTSVDHIIPLAGGGPHVFDNLALTHFSCNSRKGAKSFSHSC